MTITVTKHCKPADRLRMLDGHFKIGSHQEYSNAEKTGLLSDSSEGMGSTNVLGNLRNWSGNVGGAVFIGSSFIDNGAAIRVREIVNTLMFCTSSGGYRSERHQTIINGNEERGYSANPDVAAFLTLDAIKLREALQAFTDEKFGQKTKWIFRPVNYGKRERSVSAIKFRGFSSLRLKQMLEQQAFIKPTIYTCEEEVRFVMEPLAEHDIPKSLLSKDASNGVQAAFKASILDEGKDKVD